MRRRNFVLLYAIITLRRLWAFDSLHPRTTKPPCNRPKSPISDFTQRRTPCVRGPSLSVRHLSNNDRDQEDREKVNDFFLSVEEFLDKPFFDPDAYDGEDDSFLGRLAKFVKSDYELAETIYVGTLGVILIIISQELLRIQIYGDHHSRLF